MCIYTFAQLYTYIYTHIYIFIYIRILETYVYEYIHEYTITWVRPRMEEGSSARPLCCMFSSVSRVHCPSTCVQDWGV